MRAPQGRFREAPGPRSRARTSCYDFAVAVIVRRPLLAVLLLGCAVAAAEDWTRFRGPNGSGLAADGRYPERLDPAANLVWKAAVRTAKSSPVLTDDRIFVTAFEDEQLFTQCFDRTSGELLWERAEPRRREADMNRLNEPASISPVTDGENVYVFFRDFGLISYGPDGELRWKFPLEPFANSMGESSSPIIAGGRLILQADQKFDSYVAAFDLGNGEIRWKEQREVGESWSTPLVREAPGEPAQLITTSRGWVLAHRVDDGRTLWRQDAVAPAVVASPAFSGETVYAMSYGNDANSNFERSFANRDADGDGVLTAAEFGNHAFMAGIAKHDGDRDGLLTRDEWLTAALATVAPSSLVALRFDADESEPRELWRHERSFVGVIPSPLVYQGVVYLIRNGGILETLDAETGDVLKRGRIREAVEGFSSSPVAADGKVYLAGEAGHLAVIQAAGEWAAPIVTDLGEAVFATPALSRGQVFVRTDENLYCFGEAAPQ